MIRIPTNTIHLAEYWAPCPFTGCTVTLENSVSIAKHISYTTLGSCLAQGRQILHASSLLLL